MLVRQVLHHALCEPALLAHQNTREAPLNVVMVANESVVCVRIPIRTHPHSIWGAQREDSLQFEIPSDSRQLGRHAGWNSAPCPRPSETSASATVYCLYVDVMQRMRERGTKNARLHAQPLRSLHRTPVPAEAFRYAILLATIGELNRFHLLVTLSQEWCTISKEGRPVRDEPNLRIL